MECKAYEKGFSLVELLLTIALSAIVLSIIVTLMGYSSNSMRRTKEEVKLQTEAKDIVRHISGTAMEASDAEWPAAGVPMLIIRNDKAIDDERKEMVYWQKGNKIYFASKKTVSPTAAIAYNALPEDDSYLLGEQIVLFQGSVEENPANKKKMILADIEMENGDAEFICNERIYIRNQ